MAIDRNFGSGRSKKKGALGFVLVSSAAAYRGNAGKKQPPKFLVIFDP